MEIRFEAAGPDQEEELRSLFSWFMDDRSLRGHVRVERVGADDPGRMGPGFEAVLAVLSTAAALVQLPLSYLAWRQSRRPSPPVTVNVVGADSAEVQDILRRLRGEAAEDGGAGGGGQ